MIDYSDVESVIENCFEQLQEASREKYDSDKADRTAALSCSSNEARIRN